MSAEKKKTPLIAIVAAVLLVAAAATAYFVQKTPENGSADQVAASSIDNQGEEAAAVDTAAGNSSDNAKQAEAAPVPIDAEGIKVEPGNPVVAKVDGKDITRTDVYRFIQTMPQNVQQLPATSVYPIAMEQVVNTRIVQTQADKAGMEQTPEFKRELEIVKQQIARNLYLQKQVDAKLNDKMVKKGYDEYIKGVPTVEERRARHILLETEDKAKAAIKKLDKGGEFADLAKELSVGPTASKGGDLGYFAKGEMVPEFSDAVFGMKKGEVLKTPIKTQFGWHVIQFVDARERAKPTLEQMTPAIRAELSRKVLDDLIKDWRKDAKIEQFDINGKPLKDGANVIGIIPPKPEATEKKDG